MQIGVQVTGLATGALRAMQQTLTLYTVKWEAHKAQNYLFRPKAFRCTFTCALHRRPHALKSPVGKPCLVCCSKAMSHQNQNIF